MLAAYVLEPGIRSYDVETLADIHLKHRIPSLADFTGSGREKKSFADLDPAAAAGYSGGRATTAALLRRRFAERMESEGLAPLYAELELPLMEVLAEMEMRGVRLDTHLLAEMSGDLARSMEVLEDRIAESAGEPFNINSPKQLAHILFEKLGLKPLRKGKTGYSTDIDVLTKLAALHELPNLILEYRQLAKLKSTYVDALPQMINPETGRVHTSFNQAVTSTGRLSSSNPNLQNIPIRTELGRNIRRAFIAESGNVILSADYSQIELRIMAHISQDQALLEAFRNGADIHAATASLIFGLLPGMLSPDYRRLAKVINFGVMYGMGPHSLSEQLGITFGEAKHYIEHYFATHAGVRDYMDRIVREAEDKGYVTTLLGRKRYVTDIHSTNRNVAEFAKRTAINTPIQGSAADLIKKAMIDLSRRLKREGLAAAMILQVHDELVLEAPEREIETVQTVVKEVMEGALTLTVPLVVDTGYGPHWLDAH
jgi:DNA polymerase-1